MEMEDSFSSPPHPPPPSPYCSPGGTPGGGGGSGGPTSPAATAGTLGPAKEVLAARYVSPHCQQTSMAEYNRQSHHYTQQSLRDLKASPEYKQHNMKCKRSSIIPQIASVLLLITANCFVCSCGRSWYSGEFSPECQECDGYAMHRPCPICHGYCGKMWQRNVEMVRL